MIDEVLSGGLGFLANVGVVSAVLRMQSRTSPAVVAIGSAMLVYPCALLAPLSIGVSVGFWPLSATYWFLSLCFLMAFGAIYKSVSLRILLHLLQRPDRSDRADMVLDRYVTEEIYRNRLAVLVSSGFALRADGGLVLTARGHRIATTVRAAQRVVNIQQSG